MQNRFFLAIILSFAVMMVWSSFNPPPQDESSSTESEANSAEDSGAKPAANPDGAAKPGEPVTPAPDLTQVPEATVFGGDLVIQNDSLRVAFSQQGAAVDTVWLLEHWTNVEDKGKTGFENKLRFVRSYENGPRAFDLTDGGVDDGDALWLSKRLWETTGPAADGQSIAFTTVINQGGRQIELQRSYQFHGQAQHRVTAKLQMTMLASDSGSLAKRFWINTSGGVFPIERSDGSNNYGRSLSHVQIASGYGKNMELVQFKASEILEKDKEGLVPDGSFGCDMGVYFGAYLRPLSGVRGIRTRANDPAKGNDDWKPSGAELERFGPVTAYTQVNVELTTEKVGDRAEIEFDWYVGPKDHRTIKNDYANDDEVRTAYLDVADAELTAQGSFCCINDTIGPVIQVISKAVVWMISFFTGLFGSTGIAIIVLTVCVRVIMFPITRKSQVAMHVHSKKMAKIKPRIEALKEKHKNDQQKFAAEQMKLMKQEGVKLVPLGGCLPVFLQIPVFFGLFSAIRFDYELRHAAFLWCQDLSMPDTVIAITPISLPCCFPGMGTFTGLNVFPLLMIAAMFFHQLGMPKSPDPQMQQQQKMMMFMPLFFGLMMYGYAAGLSVYWLSSSLFGIFEQRVIKKMFPIDKDEVQPTPVT